MHVNVSELPHNEVYNILLSSVGPRPIAWVSTVSASGELNLAPFSFFNCVCVDPPMLAFSPGMRAPKNEEGKTGVAGVAKDTLSNVRETREFVVNIVTYELLEQMNITSGEYEPDVNEFELAGLTAQPSKLVRPPRVGESPVSFECKLHQILDFSSAPTSSSLVVGRVVAVRIDDKNLKGGRIDRDSLDLVGRMGGIQYTRTRERIELARPKIA
jgi:flavin reductase (DIM6/NTAB) family NADH-FMN oxidoreductase RutF